jgi:competence protein ComFB
MKLHNTMEEKVITRVEETFKTLEERGKASEFCTCSQCKMDIICYTLNRLSPHYIVSHRGASRVQWENIERQQQIADIAALIHEGLKRVNHNQRPNFSHGKDASGINAETRFPVFNIPTIVGRLFNGNNFSPICGVDVELLWNGELAPMKDGNWHNPYRLVSNSEGTYSFWPAPARASMVNDHNTFSYTLRVSSPEFETLNHFFKIPVGSEIQENISYSLERTYKLPDLYLFPPGEAEINDGQD